MAEKPLLAFAVTPEGIDHVAVLRPGPEGRSQAVALFKAIAPAVDEFDRRVKELAKGAQQTK